jgi:hypothetical protein
MQCHADNWGELAAFVYAHLGWGSIIIGVVAWILYLSYFKIKKYELDLSVAMAKFLAGTAIIPAIAIGFSAISPGDFLGCVTGLELYIVVGALSVLWISWGVLFPNKKK